MFSIDSLPRKWSIRKTSASPNTACTEALSCLGRREVGAERLLDDDARPLCKARLAEHRHDARESRGRDGEVVEAPRLAADLLLGLLDGSDELGWIVRVGGSEREALDELFPFRPGSLAHAARLDGVVRSLPELLVGERARAAGRRRSRGTPRA